jgi:hypothetical protein
VVIFPIRGRLTLWRCASRASIASERSLLPEKDCCIFVVERAGRASYRAGDGSFAFHAPIFLHGADTLNHACRLGLSLCVGLIGLDVLVEGGWGTFGSFVRLLLKNPVNLSVEVWKMRRVLVVLLFVVGVLLVAARSIAAAQRTTDGTSGGLTGKWTVKADFYGTPLYFQLELKDEDGKLTGKLGGHKLEGTATGNGVHFVAKGEDGRTEECTATVKDGTISGTIVRKDAGDPEHPGTHSFTATLALARRAGAPQRHEFTPTKFYRQFSAWGSAP